MWGVVLWCLSGETPGMYLPGPNQTGRDERRHDVKITKNQFGGRSCAFVAVLAMETAPAVPARLRLLPQYMPTGVTAGIADTHLGRSGSHLV